MKPQIKNFFTYLYNKENKDLPFILKILDYPEKLTPKELSSNKNIFLEKSNISSLPDNLKLNSLHLYECLNIRSLPDNLHVKLYANLIGCDRISSIGKNTKIGWDLNINSVKLGTLPHDLYVGGDLIIYEYTFLYNKSDEDIRKMCPNIKGKIIRHTEDEQ